MHSGCLGGVSSDFWPLERSVYFNLFLVILPKFGSLFYTVIPYKPLYGTPLLGLPVDWLSTTNWDCWMCVTYSINYQRLTLESWYTNLVQETINRCQTTTCTLQTTYAWPQTSTDRRNNKTTTDQSLQLWSLGDKTSRQKWQQQKTRQHA